MASFVCHQIIEETHSGLVSLSRSHFLFVRYHSIPFLFYLINLGRSYGHHRWIRNNPFPCCPVFSCPSWDGNVHSALSLTFSSHLYFCLSPFVCPFTVPCRIVFAKPEALNVAKNISVSISSPGSGVHHILQRLLGSLYKRPNWKHGPCTKFSIASGSICSQKPVVFL